MNRRGFLMGLAVAAAAGGRGATPARPDAGRRWGRGYFPNFVLRTQDDRPVRFYDDLLEGKIVTINMIYTTCNDICPPATANLVAVQRLLGDRVGRTVFMYSLSLDPEDTPGALKAYADRFGVRPGWLFLAGKPAETEVLRRKLGFYDPDPEIDRDRTQHAGMLRYGNEPLGYWGGVPALTRPERIVEQILWMEVPI